MNITDAATTENVIISGASPESAMIAKIEQLEGHAKPFSRDIDTSELQRISDELAATSRAIQEWVKGH